LKFLEPENGSIIIDGLDTRHVATRELRRRIVYISQDAVLVKGTIRRNLDLWGAYDDEILNDALRRVGLLRSQTPMNDGSRPASLLVLREFDEMPLASETSTIGGPDGREAGQIISLDTEVEEQGRNLSNGQRQLIALSRGLISISQSPSVLLLDEVGSALDDTTDKMVHDHILKDQKFAAATIISVEHRLSSIKLFDQVLVLEEGRVMEYGPPEELLASPHSSLSHLFKDLNQHNAD